MYISVYISHSLSYIRIWNYNEMMYTFYIKELLDVVVFKKQLQQATDDKCDIIFETNSIA